MPRTLEQDAIIENINFELDVWIRYYDRRRCFFSKLYFRHSLITVFLLLVVLLVLGSPMENTAVIAGASVLMLIVHVGSYLFGIHDVLMGGFAGAVSFYDRMYRSFMQLKILAIEEKYEIVQKQKHELFARAGLAENSFCRAIWICEYNQTCIAHGLPVKYSLTMWQRVMANILSMRAVTFKVVSDISAIPDIRPAYY